MKESDINKYFKDFLDWGYKIPDPPQVAVKISNKRPFDGFGVYNKKALYWEGKYLSELKSFNLKHIQPHQQQALESVALIENALILIVLGVHVKRGETRFYIFDWNYIKERISRNENILKKELQTLPHLLLRKGIIQMNEKKKLEEYIIDESDI